jgi:hypothetical protein
MIGKPRIVSCLVGALGAVLIAGMAYGQTGVEDVVAEEQRRIRGAQQAQEQIDTLVNTTQERFQEYLILQREIENLQVYNRLLDAQIEAQDRQIRDIRRSISQVTVIERQMLPLMTRMIDGLETFIELDMPFFIEQRRARVAQLRELMTRADVDAAEQFRVVLQAWQTEIDYGRFRDTYTAELNINGTRREVDFLVVGRVALLYITPDGRQAGAWDNDTRQWVPVGREYHDEIRQGIQSLSDPSLSLFMIPVAPPEEGN